MDRVKERERERAWEMEKAKRKRMDEGATIKAKTGRRQRGEKENARENNKHENAVHVPNDRFNNHKNHKKQRSRVE